MKVRIASWFWTIAPWLFPASLAAGPDLVVGFIDKCEQLGRIGPDGSGTLGLSCDTIACNQGDAPMEWNGLPDTRHPLITLNFYRLQTVNGADRFEQVGQSWVKHTRHSDQADECGFGCAPSPAAQLGPGCSDTYVALQLVPCVMGPRSIVHPFTGAAQTGEDLGPGGDCASNYPSADHRDHVHTSISHRLQVQEADLRDPAAAYFAEAQYLTPDEFGAGAQFNNVAYRPYQIDTDGGGNYFVDPVGATVSEFPALDAWSGATQFIIKPDPSSDGRAILAYKATPLEGGRWHYEYAIYNMNLDRGIWKFSVPIPEQLSLTSIEFHAPVNHIPEPHAENYSDAPWDASISQSSITWSSESYRSNPNANAVRWGTLYNFRFDANAPPQMAESTVGFFKTGGEVTVSILAPTPPPPDFLDCNQNGIPDPCDVQCGLPDCNIPDCGQSPDCDANTMPDECQVDPCSEIDPTHPTTLCGPIGTLPFILLLALSLYRYVQERVPNRM